MPQSLRRKSCQACARSKRRCDLTTPRCRRCQNTRKECLYPWLPPADVDGDQGTVTALAAVPMTPSMPSVSAMDDGTDFLTAGESLWTSAAGLDVQALQGDVFSPVQTIPKPLSPMMLSLLQDIIVQPGMPSQPGPFESSFFETGPPLYLPSAPASSNSTTISSVAPPPKPNVGLSVFIPRTEYAARRMAAQASALAIEGQTTFIHQTQIASSAVLRDAISSSALHAMRNPANAFIVRSEVARRAQALVDAVEAARAQFPPPELDMLHPVQALVIYQCIRLFSTSDVAQQAQAERDGAHLRAWVDKLREQLHSLVPPLAAQTQIQSWESWVRCESVRRTVVFAELLDGIYTFLKYGWDSAHGRVQTLEFTAQAGLWEARSAAEWRAVQAASPPLHATLATFDADTLNARPCDVDDLSVAIRAVNNGLESLEEWLASDAAAVEKWGLRADTNRPASY